MKKKDRESKWIFYTTIPQWWPGKYEGLTEAEAMAQVGTAYGKESDATAARSAAMESRACRGQD